jgi:NADH pyrophosphatase NudC (nudix superfamily)
MVRRSTSQPQAVIAQRNSLILSDDTDNYSISATTGDYISIIISESDNKPVVSTEEKSKIAAAADESSSDLTPEEIEDLRESFREIEEGKYKVYENADALIRDLKSDKD